MNPDQIIKQTILSVLRSHRGEAQRIRKEALRREVQRLVGEPLTDRQLRAYIQALRASDARGCWICASLKGGYFMARDLQELERSLGSDERRAANLFRRTRAQKQAAGLQSGSQLELF